VHTKFFHIVLLWQCRLAFGVIIDHSAGDLAGCSSRELQQACSLVATCRTTSLLTIKRKEDILAGRIATATLTRLHPSEPSALAAF
jgi:type IV pilus biogenesis protein CpaD/CtpE